MLALAELVSEFADPWHISVLEQGARWLAAVPSVGGRPLPGLYVGEAGIGAALLRAGLVLDDRSLVSAAVRRGQWIATLPFGSPDLFNGTAGRVRFHLMLWDATGDETHLRHAREAGQSLLTSAEPAADQGIRWTIPPGYDGLSGSAYLGYAHGAAGIADVLLDLFEATGDERFANAARQTGRWLLGLAVPALADGTGLDWPATEGESIGGGFWCHGAAGIGRFFLHAGALRIMEEAGEVAKRASRTVAIGTRWSSPVQCHGLAGNIEFLLDMAQTTGDAA